MLDPLSSYIARVYVKYYVLALALLSPTAVLVLRDAKLTYVALVPLSLGTTLALCVALYELARRRELETLQSLGVPLRRFAAPLVITSFGPLAVACVFAIAFAKDVGHAILYASLTVSGMAFGFAVILDRAWKARDSGALAACALGFAAQTALVACALTFATFSRPAP